MSTKPERAVLTERFIVVEVEWDRGQLRFLEPDNEYEISFKTEYECTEWISDRNRWHRREYAVIKTYK